MTTGRGSLGHVCESLTARQHALHHSSQWSCTRHDRPGHLPTRPRTTLRLASPGDRRPRSARRDLHPIRIHAHLADARRHAPQRTSCGGSGLPRIPEVRSDLRCGRRPLALCAHVASGGRVGNSGPRNRPAGSVPRDFPGIDNEDPYEGLDEQQCAELDAAVAHDLEIINEWNLEESETSSSSAADDDEFRKLIESRWREAGESRYQVHLRLANPDDLPSDLAWLTEIAR